MRAPLVSLVALSFLVAAATPGTAAARQPAAPAIPKQSGKILTLTGCIIPDPARPGGYTLTDPEQATEYRLTGTDVRDYAGRRVQVSGARPRRLQIVGGLYPSPNLAAQGGSDPTKEAIAAADPAATAPKPTIEFRVVSVQPVIGTCPPPY